jgi:fructose-1,6-bisphosphatase/inositol monophosphatase family enzyme
MSVVDPDKVAQVLVECADLYIRPRFQALKDHEISTKTGPRDLVTQADIDVEAHLARVLPDFLSGSVVVGEEGVSRGEASLETLRDLSQKIWIVDPVDGTYNFVHGYPQFGIMLACVINGQTEYGWIYDVPGRKLIAAEKGAGAFEDGRALKVRPAAAIENMNIHINPGFFPKPLRMQITDVLGAFKKWETLRCAAYEYARIVRGEADASIYSRMKAWDHLPGVLITQEAGGYVAKWDGTPYAPHDERQGLIVTGCREGWEAITAQIRKSIDLSAYF